MAIQLHTQHAMHPISSVLSVVTVSLLGVGAARAEEAGATLATRVHVALGVNSPLSWSDGSSLGGSLYVGLGEHHAIRANVARYEYRSSTLGGLVSALAGGDGDEASYSGRTSDVGIGWVYYPRRAWSGLTFELGVLRRTRDHRLEDELNLTEVVTTRTTTYAGRAMLGWSWLMFDHVFVAVAAGISVGYETGTDLSERHVGEMAVRAHVAREDVAGEGLLRLGVAFDL